MHNYFQMKLLCRLGGEEKNENLVSNDRLMIRVKLPPFKKLSVFFVFTNALTKGIQIEI